MKSKSIYNIEAEYMELAEAIINNDGEITEEQEKSLAINREELEVKSVKYGYVIKDVENEIEAIDGEIKRLNQLKSVRSNLIEKLKDTIHNAMRMYDIDEIKLQNLKINFRKSTSVSIMDENLIPEKYKTTKEVTSISKKEIADDLKAGVDVQGAYLSHNQNLQIR